MSVVGLSVEIFMKQSSICVMACITKIAWFYNYSGVCTATGSVVYWHFYCAECCSVNDQRIFHCFVVKFTQHKHQLWHSYYYLSNSISKYVVGSLHAATFSKQ